MRLAPKLALTAGLLSLVCNMNCGVVFAENKGDVAQAGSSNATTNDKQAQADSTASKSRKTGESKAVSTVNLAETDNVDRRLARMENRITNGINEGPIGSQDAEDYRAAITRLAEEEAECLAYAGKLNSFEELKLQTAIDRLEKTMRLHRRDRKIAIPDLSARHADLQHSIDRAAATGRLTQEDQDKLSDEMKSWQEERKSLMKDGGLSYSDSLVLSMRHDAIISHLGHVQRQRPVSLPDLSTLVSNAEKSVADSEHKAPDDAVAALKKRLDGEKNTVSRLNAISDPWTKLQLSLGCAATLEELKTRAELLSAGKNMTVDVAEREKQIDHALAHALMTGKLTPPEAHELKAELESIITEQKNNPSVMTANADQPPRVALELERLSGRLTRAQHAPRQPWPGVMAYQVALDQHIDDALAASRITADQAKELKASTDAIAKEESLARASESKVDSATALQIAIELQRVAVQLHHELKDRNIKTPDVAALQTRLDKLISDSVENGKLRVDDNLTGKVNHITSLKELYEKSEGGLDLRANLAIAAQIQNLIADVEATIHHDVQPAVPLDTRLNQMSKEISNAVASGILGVDRAAQYKAAVDTVSGELQEDRSKTGGLSVHDSFVVANDIAVLDEQLQDELRENASMPAQLVPRYRQLVMEIGRAASSGRITAAEADAMFSVLNKKGLKHAQAEASQGGLSHGEGLYLTYGLDRMASELESRLRDEPVPIGNIANRAMHIDSMLANALASGKLTVTQSKTFEAKLEKILASGAAYNNSGTGMSYPEALTVCIELDRLRSTIEDGLDQKNTKNDLETRQAYLQQRIKDAVTNGKLNAKDAEALRYDLDRIADSEASFRISDEGLNFAEALTISQDLDRVSSRLESLSKGQLSLKSKPKS